MEKDIRWEQRFQSLEKSFLFFERIVEKKDYSLLEIGGLVHSFESAIALELKIIMDYLYSQGIETRFPREAVKEGFNTRVIENGHGWMNMLEKRNELSHTYNEEVAEHAIEIIKREYYPSIAQVYRYFKSKING